MPWPPLPCHRISINIFPTTLEKVAKVNVTYKVFLIIKKTSYSAENALNYNKVRTNLVESLEKNCGSMKHGKTIRSNS
jgi:hypothetical protein